MVKSNEKKKKLQRGDSESRNSKKLKTSHEEESEGEDKISPPMISAESLFNKISLKSFQTDYFEKKPLLLKGALNEISNEELFSKQRLLNLIASNQVSLESDLHGNGKSMTICKFVDGEKEVYEHSVDKKPQDEVEKMKSLFDSGYSVQFYQPQRYCDEFFAINSFFEKEFGSLAGASAYLTPPSAQALAPHHDDVEVFVLQTEGVKHWKLYKPLMELAGEHSSDLSIEQIGEPIMEVTLEKGDLLYFPRGLIHQACTDGENFSTHVTISVYQHNSWGNFMEVALPRVLRSAFDSDIEYRRGMPINYLEFMGSRFLHEDNDDSPESQLFVARFKNLVAQLIGHVKASDLHKAADEASLDFVCNRLPPLKQIYPSKFGALDFEKKFRFVNRSFMRIVIEDDDECGPNVAIYYSTKNCKLHHMGNVCTCEMNDVVESEDSESESEIENKNPETEDDVDTNDNDDKEDEENFEFDGYDSSAETPEIPTPEPKNVRFSSELINAVMHMYTSYPKFLSLSDLTALNDNESALRGMILRLWSEDLLQIQQ